MTFDKWELVEAYTSLEKGSREYEDKWSMFLRSGLFGFIYARLAQGEWNPDTNKRKDGSKIRRNIIPKPGS